MRRLEGEVLAARAMMQMGRIYLITVPGAPEYRRG